MTLPAPAPSRPRAGLERLRVRWFFRRPSGMVGNVRRLSLTRGRPALSRGPCRRRSRDFGGRCRRCARRKGRGRAPQGNCGRDRGLTSAACSPGPYVSRRAGPICGARLLWRSTGRSERVIATEGGERPTWTWCVNRRRRQRLGVARDCTQRGLTWRFESNDIAFGASGNNSGMIHAGRAPHVRPGVRNLVPRLGHIQRIAPHSCSASIP